MLPIGAAAEAPVTVYPARVRTQILPSTARDLTTQAKTLRRLTIDAETGQLITADKPHQVPASPPASSPMTTSRSSRATP